MQVHPIKSMLKAPGTMLLKLKYDEPLSTFAFKFNVRRYIKALARIIFATHDEKDKEFEARPYHCAPKCSGHLVTLLLR